MRITHVAIQDFRNFELVRIGVPEQRHFLLGENAQGKSNFLEALGFLSAMRSFRVSEIPPLIRAGQSIARIIFKIDHEEAGEQEIEMEVRRGKKRVLINGDRISKLSSIIGRYPVVTLSSEDMEFLRGNPATRRRFLDLVLSTLYPEYLEQLKRYTQSLRERNQLLKAAGGNADQCDAFERQMAPAAFQLVEMRRRFFQDFRKDLEVIYNRISTRDEMPELVYKLSSDFKSEVDFRDLLQRERERDRLLGNTRVGPHRDDFLIQLQGRKASAFASEGQKRGLVVALRLAECEAILRVLGVRPVLIADDVVGELDAERRNQFWNCLDDGMQVFASGTLLPDARFSSWNILEVNRGSLQRSRMQQPPNSDD